MQYRKFRADDLFDGYRMKGSESVLVLDQKGIVTDIISSSAAGDDVQYFPGILSPGLINCHCHLELSHMRNAIPEKTGLVGFVTRVIQDRHATEDKILAAIEEAEDEMIADGIVAVGDICNNTFTLPQKLKGRVAYHNFIEASGFAPEVVETRFQRAVSFFNEYTRQYTFRGNSSSIAPHAPYSVSEELWEKIIHFPGNRLMTIHNQETAAENELFLSGTGEFLQLYQLLGIDTSFFKPSGKNSLQTYLPKFLSGQQVIMVHNVFTTPEDLHTLRLTPYTPHLYWCLCPKSNLYITDTLPDASMFVKEGVTIVLGTDSLASNHRLSILSEMQTIHRHFPSIAVKELLKWATINGAKALQMDNLLGSFEKGKQPGVVLLSNDLSGSERLL